MVYLDGEFIWFYVRLTSNGWHAGKSCIYVYATPCIRIYLSRKNVLTLMVVAPAKYDRHKSKARFAFKSVYHMTIYNDRHTHYSFIKSQLTENYCINILFLPCGFTMFSWMWFVQKWAFSLNLCRQLCTKFSAKNYAWAFSISKTIVSYVMWFFSTFYGKLNTLFQFYEGPL